MNEPKFVPGDRVVICTDGATSRTHLDGAEAVVLGVSWVDNWEGGDKPEYGYSLDLSLHMPGFPCAERFLRKLPPNTPSTFEECIFKPEKVKV